jgi:putative transposase
MANALGISGVKFALRPSRTQAAALSRWIGCERAIYNAKVDEDRYFWAFKRMALSLAGMRTPVDATFAQLKDPGLAPWQREVPAYIHRNGASKWHHAKWRAMRGEAGQPKIKGKGGRQSVLLTGELYRLEPLEEGETGLGAFNRHRLWIGTKKFPVGHVDFVAHRDYRLPKQIVVSRENGDWAVSFCFGAEAQDWAPAEAKDRPWWAQGMDPRLRRGRSERLHELENLSDDELRAATLGIDRGVANPASDSRGRFHAFDPVTVERAKRKAIGIRRHQRKLARQQRGSANSRKTKARIAAKHGYAKRVRKDWAEKTSHMIAADDSTLIVALEDLNVKGMTKAPAPRPDPKNPGQFLKNGARAKAGLNRAILGSAWGLLEEALNRKLEARGKLLVKVPAARSSQECSECGRAHPDNRPSQAVFRCLGCGHAEHADLNAPKVAAGRAVGQIRSGAERLAALEAEGAGAQKAARKAAAQAAKAAKKAAGKAAKEQTGAGRSSVPAEEGREAGASSPAPGRSPAKQEASALMPG